MSGNLFKIDNYFSKDLFKKVLTLIYANFKGRHYNIFKAFYFFCCQKIEKNHPQKFLRKTQIHFFSLLPWVAQTAQTEEFIFQNVAYRPTVYRTGTLEKPFTYSCFDLNFSFIATCIWHIVAGGILSFFDRKIQ